MAQKLVFDKLKTKQSELQITFDGINYESYNVNSLKANGLEIPDTCDNFDNIKIKDKDNNEINEFYYLLNDFSNPFYKDSKVKRIKIADNITSIGRYAFNYCNNLTSIVIPDSVTFIERYAFNCCNSLTSIIIPNSVKFIKGSAFNCCSSLTNIGISEDNQYFTVENQILFNKNKSILIYYFNPSSAYEIPNSVTTIGDSAFFDYTSLTSITIPDSVTTIEQSAFSMCSSLTSIMIPDSVTSIGNAAFFNCNNLTSIIIPDSVTHLGDAFLAYANDISIKYRGTEEQWASLIANNRYWNTYLSSYSIIYNYDESDETGSVDVTITVSNEP